MYRIYTCGKMKGLTYEEAMSWREKVELEIRFLTDKAMCIHPPRYYSYQEQNQKTEREIFEYELSQVKNCDVLIVNLADIEQSVGSCFEIATAVAANNMGGHHTYIIGIGSPAGHHPWILESCMRIEPDEHSAAEYIAGYLLL